MAAALDIRINGQAIPNGIVSLRRGDEILWSEGTGRSAESGVMVGSVVAAKNTYSIQWGIITQEEYAAIISIIPLGFFTLTIATNGGTIANIQAYRGNISGDYIGKHGGRAYWQGVAVDFIER